MYPCVAGCPALEDLRPVRRAVNEPVEAERSEEVSSYYFIRFHLIVIKCFGALAVVELS